MTATMTDWLGRIIDGRYTVEAVLGHGGMGVVLAARHKFTRARVAVKMVRTDLGIDAEVEARFLAEARVPAAIDHRSVVKTLDAGKTPEGELYIVMELLNGRSLREQMTSGLGGPSTRRIGMELLDVLAAAHTRAIIHRDVKPENVFLVEPELSVKLLDFGITKLLAGTSSVLPRTAAGAMLGTLAYMAPEQLVDASSVDARADLWSVGVILYEMLSGRRPYRATTVEDMITALMKIDPDPIRIALPSATPDVEAFFARALARQPQRRFSSAAEMAMAFAQLPVAAAPPPVARPAGGPVTMATGFAATAVTPDRGSPSAPATGAGPRTGVVAPYADASAPVLTPFAGTPSAPHADALAPVLTPFAGTPAVMIARPAFAAAQSSLRPAAQAIAQPAAQAMVNRGFAAPPTPSLGTLATAASPGHAVATSTGARRRFAWALGGVSTLALGAAIVVAASGRHPPSPQPHADREPIPSPAAPAPAQPDPAASPTPAAPDPAPSPEPAAPDPGIAPGPATRREHAPSPEPGPPRRRVESPPPSVAPAPPRSSGSQRRDRPLDPVVGSTPARAHPRSATPGPPDPAKPSPAPAPEAPRPGDACAAGCKMLASCRLGSPTCEADCAQRGTLGVCLQQAAGDCNRFAACWFASSCHGTAPSGQHTCAAAMDCEATCNGSPACICSCVAGVSISHAAALLGYNGCALSCRDADCIARRCGPQARSCRAQ